VRAISLDRYSVEMRYLAMKLSNIIRNAIVGAILTVQLTPHVVHAEKLTPSAEAWRFRVKDFLKYYARTPLQVDADGRLAIGANGAPLGAVRDAQGLPLPIKSIDGRTGAMSDPSTSAGIPVEIEIYLDQFSKEFQLQVSYARDAQGRLPSSISFLVNDGVLPSAGDSDKWAVIHVDATDTVLDNGGFQLPGDANRPKLTVCKYQPIVADPLLSSCLGQTPLLSSLKAEDESYITGTWSTGLEKYKRVEIADFTHGLLQVHVRQFTVNFDATPILTAFGDLPGLGVGPQGSTANVDDTTVFPPFGLMLAASASAEYTYSGAIMIASVGGNDRSLLQLIETPVNSRCPINCVGDIWGTQGANGECSPVQNPTPTGQPAACQSREFINNLFALDGGAAGINELVKYSSRRIRRFSKTLPATVGSAIAKAAKKNEKDSEVAFNLAWTVSWSFPQVMVTCDNGVLPADCQVNDLSGQANTYVTSATQVRDASLANIKQLGKIRRLTASSAKKKELAKLIKHLTAQTKLRYEEAIDLSKEIPSSSVQCASTVF
jgi:hypothetical protein